MMAGDAKRVLMVAPQPFYQDRGTPIAVRHVLTALSRLGYQVDVLTFPMGNSPTLPGVTYYRIPNPLRIASVPVGFSWRKVWLDLFLAAELRRRLRRARYDCIHAVEESAGPALAFAQSQSIPVIYDMQSSLAEQLGYLPFLRNRPAHAALDACERWLLRRVSAVMCSAGLSARVRSAVPGARVHEWRFPVSTPDEDPRAVAQIRAELRLDDRQPVVVYTGTFETYQGLSLLVEAIPSVRAQIPDAVFVFVGGDAAQTAEIARRLDGLVPSRAYRVVPRQPREEIAHYLSLATVLVSPRTHGGNLPLKTFDYLAAGRPIVVTDIAAHRAVLDDTLAVFAEPTSEGLSRAICAVLQDGGHRARLQAAGRAFVEQHLKWDAFTKSVAGWYDDACASGPRPTGLPFRAIDVVIPARNEASRIGRLVSLVRAQRPAGADLEVLVVDDGSRDGTAESARKAGARVVSADPARAGNPAAARNLGAASTTGDLLIFLDADCAPAPGWLDALLAAHERGAVCVGGSLALPQGLSATARWDYYSGWYHAHPKSPGGPVRHHPPCNLSIRRDAFDRTSGFCERQPIAYSHEELEWQAELQRDGHAIVFEPRAVVEHWNRAGLRNLFLRHIRWGYSAIESKAQTGVARADWLYRFPALAVLLSVPLAPLQAAYIIGCWLRAGVVEPLIVWPVMLAARLVYAGSMAVGGCAWLLQRRSQACGPVHSALEQSTTLSATDVTATICTRNRPEQLRRALESLTRQNPTLGEILVVDNAPADDATRRLVDALSPSVRYVREERPGLDVARNRALREARRPVVAFLDDDAVASPGWARAIAEAFTRGPRTAVCTTRVEAFEIETPAQRLFEANGGFSRGTERIRLPADAGRRLHGWRAPLIAWAVSVGNGAGFAVRRDAVLALGGFDEALDRGAPLPGGGDLDIFWRALAAGHELVYEPDALTLHQHRRDAEQVRRQLLGHQRALIAFLCKTLGSAEGGERVGLAAFLLWRLTKPGVRLARRLVGRDPLPASWLLGMWWQTIRGLWAYPASLRAAEAGGS